jgi:hypothetical protein
MNQPRRVLATPAEIAQRKKARLLSEQAAAKIAYDLRIEYADLSVSTASEASSLIERVLFATALTPRQLAILAGLDLHDVIEAYRERRFKPAVGMSDFWAAIMRLFDERMSLMIATRTELGRLANGSQGRRLERRELMTKRKL